MIHAVWCWLRTAFSTYVLHTEHGNGYQWWSGFGGRSLGVAFILGMLRGHLKHHHNDGDK